MNQEPLIHQIKTPQVKKNIKTIDWNNVLSKLDYAFQPIVNIHSGVVHGYEALLRYHEKLGFWSISDLFNKAYEDKVLFKIELFLREKSIKKFCQLDNAKRLRLFFNIDHRAFEMPDYKKGYTSHILQKYELPQLNFCAEIFENRSMISIKKVQNIISSYRAQNFQIAIDDIGAGFAGFQFLYHSEPDFIKIDRSFISNIDKDKRKKIFVSKIINLANVMRIKTIAEGVETKEEFYICRDIGFDLVQGFFIQKPSLDMQDMKIRYDIVTKSICTDRRNSNIDEDLVNNNLSFIVPIKDDDAMITVFERFKNNRTMSFFPVINKAKEPIGIIRESDIKGYVYSPFGKEVLLNKCIGQCVKDFISPCPTASKFFQAEKILEIFSSYSTEEETEGVIITENSKYAGFLTAKSLLQILNEKNIANARDQSPLTKLPGNNQITAFMSRSLADQNTSLIFVYIDIDNFKPFNDYYGFRRGDRAIQIMADILKEFAMENQIFIGHIGGDDFFIGIQLSDYSYEKYIKIIENILDKFCHDAVSLYDDTDRVSGFIISKDREGNQKKFPFLTASAAVLIIPIEYHNYSIETIGHDIARQKKLAKESMTHMSIKTLSKNSF